MARPRKRFSHSVGRYGATVRIYEPRLGAPLRFDWRDESGRHRPEVEPELVVRPAAGEPADPSLEQKAVDLCERKAAALRLEPLRQATTPFALTLADAYALYFDRRREALPPSPQARKHHEDSRAFWMAELGGGSMWGAIAPADVRAALFRVMRKGQVASAVKRLQNLRTLYRFLRDGMGLDALKDPSRGVEAKELREGYAPRRPTYTPGEIVSFRAVMDRADPRFRLFLAVLVDSGARSVQVRTATRSMLSPMLDVPLPQGHAPHGYLVLPGVKKQVPLLTYLSERTRAEVDAALAGYLALWEAEYQANGTDYPLLPGGRLDRDGLIRSPISYGMLRRMLVDAEEAAHVPRRDRRSFHAFRRAWAGYVNAAVGLAATTAAGGWSRQETVEESYLVESGKRGMLEQARRAIEGRDDE